MQEVNIGVRRPAPRQAEQFRPQQLLVPVRHPHRIPRIAKMATEERRKAQPVHQFSQQQDTGIGAQGLATSLHSNAAVEIWLKQVALKLTHRVFSVGVRLMVARTSILRRLQEMRYGFFVSMLSLRQGT